MDRIPTKKKTIKAREIGKVLVCVYGVERIAQQPFH